MPRTPSANSTLKTARREEILAAATRVFAEKGYEVVKISDIAHAAGLSHGLLYHYFKSKEAVFAAIVDKMLGDSLCDFETDGSDAAQSLKQTFSAMVTRNACSPEIAHVVMRAMLSRAVPEQVERNVADHVRTINSKIVGLVTKGQKQGTIRNDYPAQDLAVYLMSVMRGLSIKPPGALAKVVPQIAAASIVDLAISTLAPALGTGPRVDQKSSNRSAIKATTARKATVTASAKPAARKRKK